MRRKRFGRQQRQPSFNRLTMNVEFARALGELDGQFPTRTVNEPTHVGQGAQWQPRDEDVHPPSSAPVSTTAGTHADGLRTDGVQPDGADSKKAGPRDIPPRPIH